MGALFSQAAVEGTEAQIDLASGFDGLIQRGEQFDVFSPFESVHKRFLSSFQAPDHMFVVSLVTKAIDVRMIDRESLSDISVILRWLTELPGSDPVHSEAANLDGTPFTED